MPARHEHNERRPHDIRRDPRTTVHIVATGPGGRTHHACRSALACLVAASALLAPATSAAADLPPDPTPSARFFARERILIDAWETRRLDGTSVRRRAVRNQLDLAWVDEHVTGVFAGSFLFDEGLPGRPGDPLVRDRQLQPELQRAYVRWRLGAAGHLEAGRHDLVGPLGFARLDGVSGRLGDGPWALTAAAGLRPDDGLLRIDGWAYLPDTDRTARDGFGAHTVLVEGGAAFDVDEGGVSLSARHERTVDRAFVAGTRIAAGVRLGPRDERNAAVRVRTHAQTGTVERLDATLTAPVGERMRLTLAERRVAPRLPPDSVFSVFPVTEYSEERASVTVRVQRMAVEMSAIHRVSRPIDAAPDRAARTGGGRLGARARSPGGRVAGDASVEATGGDRGDAVRVAAGVAIAAPHGPTWHARQSLATQNATRSISGRRTGAFSSAGLTAVVGGWARVSLHTTAGWDDRNGLSARVAAFADIALPGAR